jgi:TolA-binding protein
MYKNIIGQANWKFAHPEARFQMSLAMIANKQEQEAMDNLKTIIQEHPDERKTVEEATKIMRWLTYKKNSDLGGE